MKSFRTLTISNVAVGAGVALVIFSLGWYASRFETLNEVRKNTAQPVRYADPDFELISPLVSVAIPNATGFPELKSVKNDVLNIINAAKARGDITSAGVYFRLPGNAHWFGINENEKFSPGSLIKVPIMMAFLKVAETKPQLMNQQYSYNSSLISDIPDALKAQLPTGRYSGEKLLQTMIMQSDNVAKELLYNAAGDIAVQDVFDEMNINFLTDPTSTISPKSYVIILSRIYNATYLDRFHSNYAMNLLSETTFKDGLKAGVPENIRVAHKYGESGTYEDRVLTSVELHDCGLVYVPDSPYYLCVMTKGSNTANLAHTIQDISAAVYKARNSFKPVL